MGTGLQNCEIQLLIANPLSLLLQKTLTFAPPRPRHGPETNRGEMVEERTRSGRPRARGPKSRTAQGNVARKKRSVTGTKRTAGLSGQRAESPPKCEGRVAVTSGHRVRLAYYSGARARASPPRTWAEKDFRAGTSAEAGFTVRPAAAPFAAAHPGRAPRAWPPRGPREALLRWGPQCWFRSRASEEEPLGADGWQVPETRSPELSRRTRGDEALLPAGVLGSTRRRASEVLGVVPGPAAPASVTWALGQSDKPRPHPGPAESGTRGVGPRFPWRPWFRGSLTWGH